MVASVQNNLSGDTFSIEALQYLQRTKNILRTFGKEFPFKSGGKLLRTFFWCLYRKGVAIHAYLTSSENPYHFHRDSCFCILKTPRFQKRCDLGALKASSRLGLEVSFEAIKGSFHFQRLFLRMLEKYLLTKV